MSTDVTPSSENSETRRPRSLVNIDTLEQYALSGDKVRIGRHPDNDIVIASEVYASGYHAHLMLEGDVWMLHDNQSRNGTLLNNETVTDPTRLNIGDIITIGRMKLRAD